MAEYICREAIIDDLEKEIEAGNAALDEDVWINKGLRIAIRDIKDIKTADVQPVKRGKWETWGYVFHGIEWLRCSRCGKPADVSYFKLLEGKIEPATLSICGCCGADMGAE